MRGGLLALALLFAPSLAAAEPSASLEIEPVDERFTGDAIAATISVEAEAGARLTLAPVEIEGVAVRSVSPPRFDAKQGKHRFQLELVALEPGARWVGPFAVEVHHPGGTATRAEIPSKLVEIRSLLMGAESFDPKPPSEPLPILVPDSRVIVLAYVALAALIFGLLGALLARAIAKRRAAQKPPPPPRPPWEKALEALARLREERERGLDEEGVEAWADAVSDVLREYLGARYGFDGLESTTDELVAALYEREPSDERLESVRAFLRQCDLVKFAKARLEPGELNDLLDAATRIVRETRGVAPVTEGAA
jgi:hypothetical protein